MYRLISMLNYHKSLIYAIISLFVHKHYKAIYSQDINLRIKH